jgi:hypothetical protein
MNLIKQFKITLKSKMKYVDNKKKNKFKIITFRIQNLEIILKIENYKIKILNNHTKPKIQKHLNLY